MQSKKAFKVLLNPQKFDIYITLAIPESFPWQGNTGDTILALVSV